MSHFPQAVFTVRIELRLPGKTCWEKENLMPSSQGHSLRLLNGKSSAPVEDVLRKKKKKIIHNAEDTIHFYSKYNILL